MALEALLNFRNCDSSENLNSKLVGLVPKGILKGGLVSPEPASLQVRIKGETDDIAVMIAFSSDGMLVRERYEEHVLPVVAGITNVVCLRAKYLESQDAIKQFEVMSLGVYQSELDKDSLIRLCSVTPPALSTSVSSDDIDMSFRDSIEGFSRRIVRDVVNTKEDLPSISGFPATAEINFLSNNFIEGSSITLSTGTITENFPIVSPISFKLAPPSTPGLSRLNPSQVGLSNAQWVPGTLTGIVTVTTVSPHNFTSGEAIRLSGAVSPTTFPSMNGVWNPVTTTGSYIFTFSATNAQLGTLTFTTVSGSGNAVKRYTAAPVIVKTAPGVLQDLILGQSIKIEGASDPTFNTVGNVASIIDSQTFTYSAYGYPTADSGNGQVTKVGETLPINGVAIGESASVTAQNFVGAFNASTLEADINVADIGSSLQLESSQVGVQGNSYTLSKLEPGVAPGNENIILSGSTFEGGVDPIPGQVSSDLQKGDIYVVIYGDAGFLELWGYDGFKFVNLTSASTASLLDFHRRNYFNNEKHLTENEKAALIGTVGTPSITNPYVTKEDTSVLTQELADALTGADGEPPDGDNRFLTQARYRGVVKAIAVPTGQDWVQLPMSDEEKHWVVGTTASSPLQYFNAVFLNTLNINGGPTEYSQIDFTPITIEGIYTDSTFTTPIIPTDDLTLADPRGFYPTSDAHDPLNKPYTLCVRLSSIPDNGTCAVLYSLAEKEKYRTTMGDTLAGPQRIIPSVVKDIENKASELRFNAGITVDNTGSNRKLTFPTNLFVHQNLQDFTFRRTVGSKLIDLEDSFYINFTTGSGTSGIVLPFTPIPYSGANSFSANQYSKYILTLTRDGMVKVYPLSSFLEKTTDLAFDLTFASLAKPSLYLTDGSYVFATFGVQANSSNNALVTLDVTDIELFPYQNTNSKEIGSEIICGDGTISFGHFTGNDSHIRALAHAASGNKIRLLPGAYTGNLNITTNDITMEMDSGAYLSNTGSTTLTIDAARFKGIDLRIQNCNIGIVLTSNATDLYLENPRFEDTIVQKFSMPSELQSPNLNYRTQKTWAVTDGSVTASTIGDFNSADGIQDAHDAAESGDMILIYPGTYNGVSLTKDRLHFMGLGGGEVRINGASILPSGTASISISGSYNQFQNLYLQTATVGINCTSGATYNTFESTVVFDTSLITKAYFPIITGTRHNNYHPALCGNGNFVYVGDGTNSWGDYVGANAIVTALNNEPEGVIIKVLPGEYSSIKAVTSFNNRIIEGSGNTSIINGTTLNSYVIEVSGSLNIIRNLYLRVLGNSTVNYSVYGIKVDGFNNVFEAVDFESGTTDSISLDKRYFIQSGTQNRFTPHTGAPTGYVSYTVGDGKRSFGDYNGVNGIEGAIGALPNTPRGLTGVLSSSSSSTITFTDSILFFDVIDKYHYLTIYNASNPDNIGSFKIIDFYGSLPTNSIILERYDGLSFVNEIDVYWQYTAGAKIWVLPGTYNPLSLSEAINDVDIEAWGAGNDTLITGSSTDSTLIDVLGNRNKISGFRLTGGNPSTGVGIRLRGSDNVIENNVYESANRIQIDSTALRNKILDAPEDYRRIAYTVGLSKSRADFVGSSSSVIQSAVDAASSDTHCNRVFIGAGTYTLDSTINVPANVTIIGTGHDTHIVGNGTFSAFTLNSSGNQTISGIRFDNFTYSLTGFFGTTGVFCYGCWLVSAAIDIVNISGQLTMNN